MALYFKAFNGDIHGKSTSLQIEAQLSTLAQVGKFTSSDIAMALAKESTLTVLRVLHQARDLGQQPL